MYWRWRAPAAARLLMRRAARIASASVSGRSSALELASRSCDERLAQVLGGVSGALARALARGARRRRRARSSSSLGFTGVRSWSRSAAAVEIPDWLQFKPNTSRNHARCPTHAAGPQRRYCRRRQPRARGGAAPGRIAMRGRRLGEPGALGERAAARSRHHRVPARPRPGRHGVLRQAQGLGEHRGPGARRRCARRWRRPARSPATPPRTRTPGLVEPEALARDIPDLDLDHPWDLTPERAIELARACEAAGLAVDARISQLRGRARSARSATPASTATRSASSPATRATSHSVELLAHRPGRRRHAARLLVHAWRAIRTTWRTP